LADLAFTLDNLGKVNEIIVEEDVKKDALLALNRMLEFLK
jgi:quinolinate synthase